MPPRSRKPVSFVERHGPVERLRRPKPPRRSSASSRKEKLEVVRFSFADQHGVLRGKTLLASEAAKCDDAPASP
jgi:glutamine synthetase